MSNYPTQELRIIFTTSDKKIFFVRSEAIEHQKQLDDTAETKKELVDWYKIRKRLINK
tara:strand:+ start:1753 stop:1926 length:174 start_codon:yes stop_codon:yes gene_type:complete